MAYKGHCNCENIHITLPQQPPSSVLCHCDNCKRAGAAFSVNYFIPEAEMTIEDPSSTMKIFNDSKTASGNTIERHFCSTCGSAIYSRTPKAPGKVFLKATLFNDVSPSGSEVFASKRLEL
ncbi:hypothetical protein N7456_008522 [Penicillium angulare]|uniref:CENP-V/GFA domain-containing protein n=1 Tax=Penicillium angulare TaxID=116970 RepID=A0A9W9EG07_9EURO|nr:hypothetical protein N7456_013294 [Penicillium angulare]KAJ5097801.1 hypothetical protein N7456_008522 [Penicillium angulare]